MSKKIWLGLAALVIVGLVGVSSAMAFGVGNTFFAEDHPFAEERAAMQDAIENQDYESWKALMQERITEGNFNKLVEMHQERGERQQKMEEFRQARQDGDTEKLEELKAEFGENMPMFRKGGYRKAGFSSE